MPILYFTPIPLKDTDKSVAFYLYIFYEYHNIGSLLFVGINNHLWVTNIFEGLKKTWHKGEILILNKKLKF